MQIQHILRQKGREVVTIDPDATVLAAMRVLVSHNIGSVVVVEGGEVRGILTERDILRLGAQKPDRLVETRVRDAMSTDLITGHPEQEISDVMNVMTENRVRHLPVLQDGGLWGIVSIGDVVNACRQTAEEENRHLKQYIQRATR